MRGSLGEPNPARVDRIEGTRYVGFKRSPSGSKRGLTTCDKFVDEFDGLRDGMTIYVRWMEKVGERWGVGGFYVGDCQMEADAANQDPLSHTKRSLSAPNTPLTIQIFISL